LTDAAEPASIPSLAARALLMRRPLRPSLLSGDEPGRRYSRHLPLGVSGSGGIVRIIATARFHLVGLAVGANGDADAGSVSADLRFERRSSQRTSRLSIALRR
jgi:hypothetical protein